MYCINFKKHFLKIMSVQRPSSMPSDDVDVREEDQLKLNEFGRINSRLFEIRDDMKDLKVLTTIYLFNKLFRSKLIHILML